MDISIVIPAFEESKKIAADIQAATKFLEVNHLKGEILVVDDGSEDNTSKVANSAQVPYCVTLNVIRYEQHRGKGYAVRMGMKATHGKYVMFADSGLCVPYEDALRGIDLIEGGTCDIAHGSRKMQGSRIEEAQSFYRQICSRLFRWFVIYYMKVPVEFSDTQCGFKIYRGDAARHLYGKCITDGFTFDIEIILRALKEGYRIEEFPINWVCDRDSRISPSRSSWRILTELITIKKTISE